MGADRELVDLIELQRAYCSLSSPLYGVVLEAVARDVAAGGVCRDLLSVHDDDPFGSALVLRFLGAVHRLVLSGAAPALARHYPSTGGRPGPDADLQADFLEVVAERADELASGITEPVQTNEVGRSAALVGGYLTVGRLGLPLRVLELGTSAGLNLRWDRFRYEGPDWSFGDPSSPVRFVDAWRGPTPPLATRCEVVERSGCDRNPIDPTSTTGATLLRSFVWPDQLDRLARLDAAIEVARTVPVELARSSAGRWVADQLVEAEPGLVTVVVHSIVQQYLPPPERHRVQSTIEEAGRSATASAPLAWLRLEPGEGRAELRLTMWPPGGEVLLASSAFHGPPVTWERR